MHQASHQALQGAKAGKSKRTSDARDRKPVANLVLGIGRPIDQSGAFESCWQQLVNGAFVCNLPVEITKEQALAVFHLQGGQCALTGVPIRFRSQRLPAGGTASGDATLDRIDTRRGYALDNVWWLHRDASLMKLHLPLPRLLKLCRLITNRSAAGVIAGPGRLATSASAVSPAPLATELVGRYLADRVVSDPVHRETSAALWQSFLDWCSVVGVAPCTRTAFGRALRSRGYIGRRGHISLWHGLRLLPREGARVARATKLSFAPLNSKQKQWVRVSLAMVRG